MNNSKRTFSLELDPWELSVDDLWPDGDAPEDPTVEDVKALVDKCGGVKAVMRDWSLINYDEEFHIYRVQ